MSHIDFVNRFDDIYLDFLNGEISLFEALDALDDLSDDCEHYLTNVDSVEVQTLGFLLIDIANLEESLLDACASLLEEDEECDDWAIIDSPSEYIDESANTENDYIMYEDMVQDINNAIPEVSAQENFATGKEYEQMRKDWLNKRETERKAAIKHEKETPLEERYKAAMTAFKELQDDKSQAWKLDDEGSWLAEDLERWGKEAMEWKDIFSKYYTKLAREIYKKADKIEADYEAPITEEDINIENKLDDTELTEEEVADVEERAEETEEAPIEEPISEPETTPEQATEEAAKEEQPAKESEEHAVEAKEAENEPKTEQPEKTE